MPSDKNWKSLYPPNWRKLSEAVRQEAGWECEHCEVPNGSFRLKGYDELSQWANMDELETAIELGAELLSMEQFLDAHTEIVLTVAHLDQDPRNNARDNLEALCQRCHLAHDNTPAHRRRREMIYLECFGGQTNLFG